MKKTLVAGAAIIFALIGIASFGCVIFGISEIASGDAVFKNDGLGEVLTVLGVYFTIPYLFIIGTFIVSTSKVNCLAFLRKDFGVMPQHIMLGVTLVMFVLQQVVADKYLTILHGDATLAIIIFDAVVMGLFMYYKLAEAWPGMAYALLFMCKLAIMYTNAYETKEQKFFGPNGVSGALFLCIPIIQFPLYVAGSWEKRSVNIADLFVGNFNLYLSHLLHSLDVIALFSIAFIDPESNANHLALPDPFKALIGFLICISFLGNNVSVLHLFYQRSGMDKAEIVFLPQAIRDISRGSAQGAAGSEEEDTKSSHERRIFQYMSFMLVVCDVPFLIARMELWRKQYAPLSIFIAKNMKDIADVVMLMMRADPHANGHVEEKRPNGRGSHGAPVARQLL